jgi:hypothetical protein
MTDHKQLILKALDTIRSLVADPATWTTGTMARDAQGKSVEPHNPSAVCFCTFGAVHKASPRHLRTAIWCKMGEVSSRLYGCSSVIDVNDGLFPIADVEPRLAALAVIDGTIAEANAAECL